MADIGHGTLFQRGNGAGGFVTVAGVRSITPPNMTRETVDSSDMETTDRWRTHIGAMRDGGECSVEIFWNPDDPAASTVAANAWADLRSDDARDYQVLWTDGSYLRFSGVLTGMPVEVPLDDNMTATLTYKVSGAPTLYLA